MSSEPACRDRFGQRLRPERRPEPPRHLLPARRSLLSHSTWSGAGGTSDSHHILSYACKQSRHSNSVIRCSAIQWDENRKQWPRTLNSSSVIHVSTSLTSPPLPQCSLSTPSACAGFVFILNPSLLRERPGLLVRDGGCWISPEVGGLEGF